MIKRFGTVIWFTSATFFMVALMPASCTPSDASNYNRLMSAVIVAGIITFIPLAYQLIHWIVKGES